MCIYIYIYTYLCIYTPVCKNTIVPNMYTRAGNIALASTQITEGNITELKDITERPPAQPYSNNASKHNQHNTSYICMHTYTPLFLSLSLSIYIYIERERDTHTYMCIYIYIYTYIHTYIHTYIYTHMCSYVCVYI